ncbi:Single-stranded DNA-binding protein [Corynebacterium occultum]|uniref:Single-stranded DNA-binding protein n=1 Tax=Corynebacterium occultum TaxID=2675219 RepID=A0A6B8VYJ9_9CORY|nr:single-stranded DNA-binding protein [Corynebacterium occultum]QGU08109.1 Single-stranded DNA-binding protein [Corynebacterium occultum]
MPQIPATIAGNLTGEVHLRQLANGSRVARFRLAANRSYRDAEDKWQSTDALFITVDCWNQLANNVKASLAQGMPVLAVGTLLTNEWIDGEGKKQQQILLKANHVGLDMNRFVVSSARNQEAGVTVEGVERPDPRFNPEPDEVVPSSEAQVAHSGGAETAGDGGGERGLVGAGVSGGAENHAGEGDREPPF